MEATIVNDESGRVRRNAGRRAAVPAALTALVACAVAFLGAGPAEAKQPTAREVRDAHSLGAAATLAEKQRARQRRGVARHHAVDREPGHRHGKKQRGKRRHGATPQPTAPTAAPPADPAPITAPSAPLVIGPPAPSPQADGRNLAGGGVDQPPVQHGVEPDPPGAEEPSSPPSGDPDPPGEEPGTPPSEEPGTPPGEEPETPPTEEPEPPGEEPEPPTEEPEPPVVEEPEPPVVEEPEPPAGEEPEPPASGADLLFEGRTIRDFALVQAAPGAISEVADPLGSGERVLRLTVDDGDVAPLTPTENPRAQLLSPDLVEAGDEFWLKTKFLVPQGFPTINGWLTLVEIHGPPFAGSSPWQVEIVDDRLQWTRNRSYDYDVPWQTPLRKGAWVTLLLHERFAADGFVEMWIDGQPVSFFGRETRLAMKTMDSTNGGGANAAKIMNYRKAGMFETGTVYFGPLLLGSTRAAVGG